MMLRLLLALLLLSGTASAQSVQQSGTVTPGHVPVWTTNGVIQDGGTPGSPQITGGVGVANSNQRSICTQNSKTGAVSQLCLGSTANGTFLTSSTLSGPPQPFFIQVNGANFPVPASLLPFPGLDARTFGVKADGVTSDDVALKAAIDACAAGGLLLWLPPGNILLTGTARSTLKTCHVEGTSATNTFGTTSGTTFLMTSTTTGPFICGSGFRLSGVNLYWPNQTTGTTVYPPFITDDGATICAHNTIDNVVVVNAYDFIKQQAGGPGWGDWKFYNLTAWAVHDLFQMNNHGDSFAASVMRLTPGPWLDICSSPNPCATTVKAALDAASLNNAVLHVTAGPNVNFTIGQAESEAWRYGVLIDAGGSLSQSKIDVAWDGTGTLIDASSGGTYTGGNQFRGSNTICSHAIFTGGGPDTGNTPCFTMGANSELILDGFRNEAPRGDFLRISGGSATIRNSSILNVGSRNDGTDYYLVNATGVVELNLQNNKFSGTAGVHSHGVNTGRSEERRVGKECA